jgi:hypothetical protein
MRVKVVLLPDAVIPPVITGVKAAVLEIVGATVFSGAVIRREDEEAVATPEVLVPVTVKRKYCPMSAAAGV